MRTCIAAASCVTYWSTKSSSTAVTCNPSGCATQVIAAATPAAPLQTSTTAAAPRPAQVALALRTLRKALLGTKHVLANSMLFARLPRPHTPKAHGCRVGVVPSARAWVANAPACSLAGDTALAETVDRALHRRKLRPAKVCQKQKVGSHVWARALQCAEAWHVHDCGLQRWGQQNNCVLHVAFNALPRQNAAIKQPARHCLGTSE